MKKKEKLEQALEWLENASYNCGNVSKIGIGLVTLIKEQIDNAIKYLEDEEGKKMSKKLSEKYYDYSLKRCASCGKPVKAQHPDTKEKDKWVYFEVGKIGYYHSAECKKKYKEEK